VSIFTKIPLHRLINIKPLSKKAKRGAFYLRKIRGGKDLLLRYGTPNTCWKDQKPFHAQPTIRLILRHLEMKARYFLT
jgi:hypothetical protein